MRYFWIVLACFCIVALGVLMFWKNLPNLCYNLFHKKKRPVSWDPMADCNHPAEMDDTEAFYFSEDPIKF